MYHVSWGHRAGMVRETVGSPTEEVNGTASKALLEFISDESTSRWQT